MALKDPNYGAPYLCPCGKVLDVSDIEVGNSFGCPECGTEKTLELDDALLLTNFDNSSGVYRLMLEKKLESAEPLKARALSGKPALPATKTIPNAAASSQVPLALKTTVLPVSLGESLGAFRLDGILGQGGMGTVYRAFDLSLHRPVALKVLSLRSGQDDDELLDRFQREARAAGGLSHPNITHIYSIGEDRGFHYFAMELVAGRTLGALIQGEGGGLRRSRALDYLLQVARGLRAALVKKVIHRDIKPSNLMLSDEGLIKITDFGLAKMTTRAPDLTTTGVVIGTPLYMSPEQGRGDTVDHRSDIYSLGCTFYHLLAGFPPFSGSSPMNIILSHMTQSPPTLSQHNSEIDPATAELIQRMMRKHPADRFQDYDQLIDAITNLDSSNSKSRTSSQSSRGTPLVLLTECTNPLEPESESDRKILSKADVDLELGRFDRALEAYQELLRHNPQLESELGFRILRVLQVERRSEEAIEWYERLAEVCEDSRESFYCRWKLLSVQRNRAHHEIVALSETLHSLLDNDLPPELPRKSLEKRKQELGEIEKSLARAKISSVLLIRRSGRLQLELD